ncbi:MAG: ATP-binding cassette domain-containing protein [Candidatus Heimdallarchaeota archaeon]|nr:ATP-binding cassette domain-containing protein [Candidatus Heimdallarchaeota archaeon]
MDSMESYLLKCSHLTKEFSGYNAINDISFESDSDYIGLLGPNGSGKTTFIKLMLGIIRATSGEIHLNMDLTDTRVIPDHPALPVELTIDEWLEKIEDMHGPNYLEVDVQTIFQLRGDLKIKNLSAGQRRKVALFPAFYGTPKLFILDEPTNFLDIVSREQVLNLLWEYVQKAGAKVILATHRIDEMRMFSDEVLILKEGRLVNRVKTTFERPKSYSIQVNDSNLLETHFNEHQVKYEIDNIYSGNVFKVEPSINLWSAFANYRQSGGEVINFTANDELKHAIEELVS